MSHQVISTAHLDYLQRVTIDLAALTADAPISRASPTLRRLSRIKGIGRTEKTPRAMPATDQPARLLSEDVLIGLYGYKIPLAFFVQGGRDGVDVRLGTWSPDKREDASATIMDARQEILGTSLNSLYPAVELVSAKPELERMSKSGLALGIPTAKRADPLDGALPLDRLVRALSGADWACLILAEPVHESVTSALRDSVINEIRAVQSATHPATTPSPLGEHYTQLLQGLLKALTSGQSVGAWRTSVYLLGDARSYHRLASIWRGIFSGDHSLPEPVRVWESALAADLAVSWAMCDTPGSHGPGHYKHPFEFQTLLTSTELSAYIHLPQLETSGFTINAVADFDASPPLVKGDNSLQLGQVIHQTRLTPASYAVSTKALTRHTFVAGVTGAGKTNTIFHMLKQATGLGIPFLVIEPAKTEYRALLQDEALSGRLQIFTLGNEAVSPLRLNPFEAVMGTPVSVHLDLLRSVFNASFGLWSVLPAVLELCLHQIYKDRGWNTATNTNSRLDKDSDVAAAFPTLSDLAAKVDVVTRALHYDPESESNIRAALLTRVNSLRGGSKGRMLDVQRSFPMSLLLQHPTILELEGIGDDDDKAFLMGLLFIRLVEFRRASGQVADLQHLLVIEEAHRLLSSVEAQRGEQEANTRGKAVETFAHLLSEIRAYGQGVFIADQIPNKLAPDVLKNTNLKIAHRVVSSDDRATLSGAMAMNERQAHSLATLTVGQAAVFSDGDDAPILVQVPAIKDQAVHSWPDNSRVAEHMAVSRASLKDETLLLSFPACDVCLKTSTACQVARDIVEDPQFQRTFSHTILSTIEDSDALDRLWPDLLSVVQAKTPPRIDEQDLLRCVLMHASHWFSHKRGAQAEWTYTQTEELASNLRQMLLAKSSSENSESIRTKFRDYVYTLHARPFSPFPACERVCQQQPPVCLYRYAVADLVAEGRRAAEWHAAEAADAADEGYPQTWGVCSLAGYDLLESPDGDSADAMRLRAQDALRRVGLCFAQQMLAGDAMKAPQTVRWIVDKLLAEADG
ncbi:MAG TPA: DUF87 domain-containing protein [Pyrinomonadaceae bacterium]